MRRRNGIKTNKKAGCSSMYSNISVENHLGKSRSCRKENDMQLFDIYLKGSYRLHTAFAYRLHTAFEM